MQFPIVTSRGQQTHVIHIRLNLFTVCKRSTVSPFAMKVKVDSHAAHSTSVKSLVLVTEGLKDTHLMRIHLVLLVADVMFGQQLQLLREPAQDETIRGGCDHHCGVPQKPYKSVQSFVFVMP